MTEPGNGAFGGEVVVVVGGSRGLGEAYCLDLGRAGARVFVVGRSEAAIDVAAQIRASGGDAVAHLGDAADGDGIVDACRTAYGPIDAMIVNAGITRDRSFAKMTPQDWREVMATNADSAFACARAVWPGMRARQRGSILLTTSAAGMHGNFGQANYAASKAAIIGLMRTLAIEGEPGNIRVNALAPMAATAMTQDLFSPVLRASLDVGAVSLIALALIHPSCRLTGELIEAGGGWAAAMRWERSRGTRLRRRDVQSTLDQMAEITAFGDGASYPSSTADCLAAAISFGARQAADTTTSE